MNASGIELEDARRIELNGKVDRPIVLVGLMGSGKSTIGRRLANLLGRTFIDADDAIEEAADMSVGDIFEEFGEPYFRDGERRVIARLLEEEHGVIATGGGAFCNQETRRLLLDKALTIWLDCDLETLVERTGRRNHRPLLRNGDRSEILQRLHAERSPFYSQASIRVKTSDFPHHQTALRILEAIEQWA